MVEPRDVELLVQSQTVNFILYSFSRHLSGTSFVLGTVLAVGKYSSYFLGVFIEEGEIDTISSICRRSVAQSCLTLCNPVDCSTSGFPVHHQLLELTQTHVHRVGDAIQPSHPLSSPCPPTFSLSQHQSFPMSQLFASGGQSRHQVYE